MKLFTPYPKVIYKNQAYRIPRELSSFDGAHITDPSWLSSHFLQMTDTQEFFYLIVYGTIIVTTLISWCMFWLGFTVIGAIPFLLVTLFLWYSWSITYLSRL